MNGRVRQGIAVVVTAAILLLLTPGADARATDDVVTWSVRPAGFDGADGRSWVELDVDPGDEIEQHLAVTNFGDGPVSFALSAADGYFTSTGRFTMLPSTTPSRGPGTWIEVAAGVEVPADTTVVVPYRIVVPDDAVPGDTAAGIAASLRSAGSDGTGAEVGLESRVGFRVMMRVSGELAPAFDTARADGRFELAWNPFRPGSIAVSYELANDGNTGLMLADRLDASGRFDAQTAAREGRHELLPGEKRLVERRIGGIWPIGLVRVVVDVEGRVTPGDAAAGILRRELWVWAIPAPQLLLVLGAALLCAAALWRRRRSRAAVRQLVADTRREVERDVRRRIDEENRSR